jgi:hypothetical protein
MEKKLPRRNIFHRRKISHRRIEELKEKLHRRNMFHTRKINPIEETYFIEE